MRFAVRSLGSLRVLLIVMIAAPVVPTIASSILVLARLAHGRNAAASIAEIALAGMGLRILGGGVALVGGRTADPRDAAALASGRSARRWRLAVANPLRHRRDRRRAPGDRRGGPILAAAFGSVSERGSGAARQRSAPARFCRDRIGLVLGNRPASIALPICPIASARSARIRRAASAAPAGSSSPKPEASPRNGAIIGPRWSGTSRFANSSIRERSATSPSRRFRSAASRFSTRRENSAAIAAPRATSARRCGPSASCARPRPKRRRRAWPNRGFSPI